MTVTVKIASRAASIIYGLAKTRAQEEGVWLLPANICPAVPLALMSANRQFEFIDIDPGTLSLDVDLTQKRLIASNVSDVAGIIYVRSFGVEQFAVKDLARIAAVKSGDVYLVDDRCLSVPDVDPRCILATQADVALFSTGYGKVLDLGYGGYAFMRKEIDCEQFPEDFEPGAFTALMDTCKTAIGENLRRIDMDDKFMSNLRNWLPIAATLKWEDLQKSINENLPSVLRHKAEINAIYSQNITPSLQWSADFQTWRFNIEVENAMSMLSAIFNAGLFASNHYAPASIVFSGVNSPVAEANFKRTLNLFNDFHFDENTAYKLSQIINEHAKENG